MISTSSGNKKVTLPSVTEVLSIWQDFSRVDPDILAQAAARGTQVHSACAAYAEGLWMPPPPEEIAGYVQSFRRWFNAFVDQVIAVETEVKHDGLGYLGHPDLVAVMRGDALPVIIDLKTPAVKSRAWAAQLAAYKAAWASTHPEQPVGRVASLRLKRDGTWPSFIEYTESARDFAGFLAALHAFKWFYN